VLRRKIIERHSRSNLASTAFAFASLAPYDASVGLSFSGSTLHFEFSLKNTRKLAFSSFPMTAIGLTVVIGEKRLCGSFGSGGDCDLVKNITNLNSRY